MRTPLSWLRDFAPFPNDPAALAADLDDLGLIVEGIKHVGEGLEQIVVARIEEISPIEGADKIRKVLASAGGEPLEIVCGASNFSVGDLVPLAPVGAVLPGGFEIAQRKMRGIVSNGMLCSGRELGLSDDQAGLLVLTEVEGARPGLPLVEALGIEPDIVFDITVEGNRPDAWCVAGVARDLAARLKLPFAGVMPAVPEASGAGVETLASLVIEDLGLCPRMTVRVFNEVTVAPSARWMARRLTLAGMRPINNVVDASNYVMLELGQPTHPYDLEAVPGPGLLVRRARLGEEVATLDGVMRVLGQPGRSLGDQGEDCVICDAHGAAIGIGGVMGGQSSEITGSTTKVLLETAYFAPLAIARTSRRLGLRTEASARFERGTDPLGIDRAADRFAEILTGHATPAPGVLDVRGEVPAPFTISLSVARVNTQLGVALDGDEIASLLEPIGFGAEVATDAVTVTVPTNRPDVRVAPFGVDDVIEEVARLYGYSRVPLRTPTWPQPGGLTAYQRERRSVRQVLAGLGAHEIWSADFVADADHAGIGLRGGAVEVANPLNHDEPVLRRSLLPGVLRALAYNADRRQGAIRLYEIGTVFDLPPADRPGKDSTRWLPIERELLGVVFGRESDDAHHAVAAWQVLADELRLSGVRVRVDRPEADALAGLHPTRSGVIVSGDTVLGALGEVDPAVAAAHGLDQGRIGWLGLDLGLLLDPAVVARQPEEQRPVSRFPSSDIDLAFVIGDETPADEVRDVLTGAGGELLESVTLFDVFRGDVLGAGRRSLAFRLRFCAMDRTLTDAEVGDLRERCIAAAGAIGATLR